MTTDFQMLAEQYKGCKLADLVLHHVAQQDYSESLVALRGLQAALRPELHEPVLDLTDFFAAAPQQMQKKLFSADLGVKFLEIVDVEKGFIFKRHGLQITKEEAFTIFNILVVNWAASCHKSPETKAAMQKAAGVGFFGRLFG